MEYLGEIVGEKQRLSWKYADHFRETLENVKQEHVER